MAAGAQTPAGSLVGTLTDAASHSVSDATVILHEAKGAQTQTITTRNGHYRFTSLPEGEYWLEVQSSQLGRGTLSGLYVAAGHPTQMHTAVAFEPAELKAGIGFGQPICTRVPLSGHRRTQRLPHPRPQQRGMRPCSHRLRASHRRSMPQLEWARPPIR